MYYYYFNALVISIVVFVIIVVIKKKPLLWISLFCLALIPLIALLLGAIYSMFDGSGLVGDSGGITSGLFAIVIYFIYQWYIYVPSLILGIISYRKVFLKKTNYIKN